MLVECKAVGKGPDAGLGQARSYAFWLKPAYYVVTDGDYLTVWNYQGGAVPDLRVCEARRATLREKFDDLYAVLNPEAALATRQQKIDGWRDRRQGTDGAGITVDTPGASYAPAVIGQRRCGQVKCRAITALGPRLATVRDLEVARPRPHRGHHYVLRPPWRDCKPGASGKINHLPPGPCADGFGGAVRARPVLGRALACDDRAGVRGRVGGVVSSDEVPRGSCSASRSSRR